jgi:hypothetical protein
MTIILDEVVGSDAAITVIARDNIQIPVHVEAAGSNLVAYTTTGADVQKDYTASVTLPAITFGAVGTMTATLVPAITSAGATGDIVVTLRPMTNSITSSVKLAFTLPSSWTICDGGSATTCAVVSNSADVASTSANGQTGHVGDCRRQRHHKGRFRNDVYEEQRQDCLAAGFVFAHLLCERDA